jgi:hypothetical protein
VLKNTFRKFTGGVILLVFGIAIFRFIQQTSNNQYVGGAVAFGLKFLLFLALVLWVVYLLDRRMKKGPS